MPKTVAAILANMLLVLSFVTAASAEREEDKCLKITMAYFTVPQGGMLRDLTPHFTVRYVDGNDIREYSSPWTRLSIRIRPDTIKHHACVYFLSAPDGKYLAIFLSEKAFPRWKAALNVSKDVDNFLTGLLESHHKGLVPLPEVSFFYRFHDARDVEFKE